VEASADRWSSVAPPAPPQQEYVPREADRWGTPTPVEDPARWNSYMTTPGAVGPTATGPTITPQDVIDAPKVDKATKKKDDFPVWAIVLIILLALCICVILPVVLVLGGGIAIFRGIFNDLTTLLPLLFI
jgi:hypothetical protein